MKRILFCELCPFTYRLSMEKEILKRHLRDFFGKTLFAQERTQDLLPVVVYHHKSLIQPRFGCHPYRRSADSTWGDLLRMEAGRKDDGAQGLQGGTDNRKGAAVAGHRWRIMPAVEPDTLDGAP